MTIYEGTCPACRKVSIDGLKTPVCSDCWRKLHELATLRQERDHLANWLNHRVRPSGHLYESATLATPGQKAYARQLRELARAMKLDYSKPLPPKYFAQRMAELLERVHAKQIV